MVSGILVVFSFQLTLPRIIQNRQAALEKAVFKVLPSAVSRINYLLDETGLNELPDAEFARANVFAGYDAEGKLVGLAMEGAAGGYQDVVRVLYGYSPEKQAVVGITVLDSRETPGLGDRVETDPNFLANFEALDARLTPDGSAIANPIETVKNGKKTDPWQIDAISGATITSTAIGNGLRGSTSKLLPLLHRFKDSLKTTVEARGGAGAAN
jgi:electron transport complex protein RnfG